MGRETVFTYPKIVGKSVFLALSAVVENEGGWGKMSAGQKGANKPHEGNSFL